MPTEPQENPGMPEDFSVIVLIDDDELYEDED